MNMPADFNEDAWLALVQEAVTLPEPPDALAASALAYWHSAPAALPVTRARKGSSGVVRWLAALAFDSWAATPAAAGLRALPSEVRQLMFMAQNMDIDLRITPQADRHLVQGQVFGDAACAFVDLEALSATGDRMAPEQQPSHQGIALNANCEFTLAGVAPGRYRLRLHGPQREVRLPAFEVGPRGSGTPR